MGSVSDDSPAGRAGLKQGDVITRYDGRPVARWTDLPRAVAETPLGREVPLEIDARRQAVTLTAKVARLEEQDRSAPQPRRAGRRTKLGLPAAR